MSARSLPAAARGRLHTRPDLTCRVVTPVALSQASDDEQQVRYISAFLTLLARGADKDTDTDANKAAAAAARSGKGRRAEQTAAETETETETAAAIDEPPGDGEEEQKAGAEEGGHSARKGGSRRRTAAAEEGEARRSSAVHRLGRGRDEYSRLKSMRAVRALCEHAAALVCDIGDALRFGYRVQPPSPPPLSAEETAGRLLHDLGPARAGAGAGASLGQRQVIEGALTVLATELVCLSCTPVDDSDLDSFPCPPGARAHDTQQGAGSVPGPRQGDHPSHRKRCAAPLPPSLPCLPLP